MYMFNFDLQILNNNIATRVNVKLMIHNFLLSLFNKSVSTNALMYFIIFSFEILIYSFTGSLTTNYLNKIPYYVLTLILFDYFSMKYNFGLINIAKGNISFLTVESLFGHIFTTYEITGVFLNILFSFIINNMFIK